MNNHNLAATALRDAHHDEPRIEKEVLHLVYNKYTAKKLAPVFKHEFYREFETFITDEENEGRLGGLTYAKNKSLELFRMHSRGSLSEKNLVVMFAHISAAMMGSLEYSCMKKQPLTMLEIGQFKHIIENIISAGFELGKGVLAHRVHKLLKKYHLKISDDHDKQLHRLEIWLNGQKANFF